MRLAREGSARLGITRALLVVGVLAVATTVIGVALAETTTKNFTASISPGPGSQSFTFQLTNHVSSNQTLGSANVTIPAGFGGVSVPPAPVAPAGKSWTSVVASGAIELRAKNVKSKLAAGESLTLTITAASQCGTGTATWTTFAKQSNDFLGTGNDFVLLGPQPSVALNGGAVATFSFATVSSPQEVGTPFSVTVTAKNACGDVATGYSGTPTLSGLASAGSTDPSYGTLAFTNGVATTSVTAVKSQVGAQLTAVDGAVTGTSNSFEVVNRLCTSSDTSCTATAEDGKTEMSTPVPPPGATMGLSFTGFGTQITCGGATFPVIGSLAKIDPVGYTAPIPIMIRWDKSVAPGTGVANFRFCLSENGVAWELAQACSRKGQLPAGLKYCELGRSRNGVGDLVIRILIAPNDPWAGAGGG